MSLRHTIIAGFAVTLLALGAGAAQAAEIETNSFSVTTAGLNLKTPEGAKKLRLRVIEAAHKVCESVGDRDTVSVADTDRCWHEAYEKAAPQMHAALTKAGMTESAPVLASVH